MGNYSDERVPCKVCGRCFAPEVLAKHANICKKTSTAAAKRKPFDSSKQRVLEGELSLRQIKQAQKKLKRLLKAKREVRPCWQPSAFKDLLDLEFPKRKQVASDVDSHTQICSWCAKPILKTTDKNSEYQQEDDSYDWECQKLPDPVAKIGTRFWEVKPPKSHWREKHEDFINSVRNARGVQVAIGKGGPLPPPPPPSINPDYIQCPYCSRRFNQQAAERHINFCKEQQSRLPRGKPSPAATSKQNARLNYQVPKPKAKTSPVTTPAASTPPARGTARGPAPSRGGAARGGAARGRAAPPPIQYWEDTENCNEAQESQTDFTKELTVEFESTSELTFPAKEPKVSQQRKVLRRSQKFIKDENQRKRIDCMKSSSLLNLRQHNNGIPLREVDFDHFINYDINTPMLIRAVAKEHIDRWLRGGGSRGGYPNSKPKQPPPHSHLYTTDLSPESPSQHYHQQHQQQSRHRHHHPQHHEDPTPRSRQRQSHHQRGQVDDFYHALDDFYTPYETPRDASSFSEDHHQYGDRTRKADGKPIKSKPSMAHHHYLNKVSSDLLENGLYMESAPLPRISPATAQTFSPFCYECGTKFQIPTAKFCCECGVKRLQVA